MFRRLLGIQLLSSWSSLTSRSRGKARSAVYGLLIGALLLYGLGCLVFIFGTTFHTVCAPLVQSGLGWLYFAVAASIAFAISFLMSLFTAESQLYEAKDNTLLLAMPIRPIAILASRMVSIWVWIFVTELLVMAPAVYIYGITVPMTASAIFGCLAVCILLPLLVLTLDCLCGWLLALLNARAKRKNIATTLFSLVLVFIYFQLYSRLNHYVQQLVAYGSTIAARIQDGFFPLYYLGKTMTGESWESLLLFGTCTLLPFALACWILVRSFARIATTRRNRSFTKYRERSMTVRSPQAALVWKELAHFANTPMYILNASMGVLLSLVGVVFLVFQGKGRSLIDAVAAIPGLEAFVPPLVTAVLCLLAGMNTISAPALSLEGRMLWLPQSLPVKGSQVLLAKAYLHMIISLPGALLASLVVLIVFPMGMLDAILVIIVPLLMHVFQALLGVVVSLRFHRFDWINETMAVKQSMSAVICMFSNFGILAAAIALYILVLSTSVSIQVYLGLFGLFLAVICCILFRYLKRKGGKKFATLG